MPLRKRNCFLAMVPVLAAIAAGAAHADEPQKMLTIEADAWCPINCAADGTQEGIGIDLARKIFEPLGYRVNYVVVPWTQALSDVRSGKTDAAVGAGAQDDASLVFPASYLFNISDDFYVMQGNPWRYQGPYTLKDKRLGIAAGYGYGDVLTQFIKDNITRSGTIQAVSGNDALAQNIAKLRAGQIDILVESKPVMDYYMQKKGETQIVWAGGIAQAPIYLAFSPAKPASRQLAAQYDAGIKRLSASGQLSAIYRAYGLNP